MQELSHEAQKVLTPRRESVQPPNKGTNTGLKNLSSTKEIREPEKKMSNLERAARNRTLPLKIIPPESRMPAAINLTELKRAMIEAAQREDLVTFARLHTLYQAALRI